MFRLAHRSRAASWIDCWVALAHRSRALPELPHLTQWNRCLSRLALKQRAVPCVEPCSRGQGPRYCEPRVRPDVQPLHLTAARRSVFAG